jgi:hypothetical protein
MKRRYARLLAGAAMATLGGWVLAVPASAVPPTVTPAPGYDARLQERRAGPVIYEPVMPVARPVARRHVRRLHHRAH